jgi:hypothetical protein
LSNSNSVIRDAVEDKQQQPDALIEGTPKIIGDYKKQGWAKKVLEKIDNPSVEKEEDGVVSAKAVLLSDEGTYYPAFLSISIKDEGKIMGVYFISEDKEAYSLIPFELTSNSLDHSKLLPFKYRTLEKIEGDHQQINWPDFS